VAEKEGNVEKKEKKIELAIVLNKRKKWKEDYPHIILENTLDFVNSDYKGYLLGSVCMHLQ
jgi:hypothetical protein